jgi:hypothetical protein
MILDQLAWKEESSLWSSIENFEGGVPSVEDVLLPNCIEGNNNVQSPMSNPVLRRIVVTDRSASPSLTIRNKGWSLDFLLCYITYCFLQMPFNLLVEC